jgi:histidinol-phosphate/aromatic aminotransferase/cobyric acid decarboxylase-like protein
MPALENPDPRSAADPEKLALRRVISIPPYPPGRPITAVARGALYLDFDTFALRDALSHQLGINPECILPGEGSSEHIVLVARAFLEPGKSALASQYSFAAYQGAVASVGARTIVAPARDFAVDLEAMLSAIDSSAAVIYLATINNPTGTCLDNAELRDRVQSVLAARRIEYVPSHGNFILLRVGGSASDCRMKTINSSRLCGR